MLLSRLREQRGRVYQSISVRDDPKWLTVGQSVAGVDVNESSAYGTSAYFACIRAYADGVSTVPVDEFEDTDTGREPFEDQLWTLLNIQPNPLMSALIYRETSVQHTVGCGNSYSYIEYDGAFRVKHLWLLRPDRTRVERKAGRLWYFVTDDDGNEELFEDWEILHVPGMGWDGTVGYRPVELMMQTLGVAIAQDHHRSGWYANGTAPGGVIEHPGRIDASGDGSALKRLRESFEARHQGPEKTNRVAILEEGAKWVTVSVSPKEAQFLEGMQDSAVQIARFMRIPASEIDAAGGKDSLTYSTLEQDQRRLMQRSFRPLARRFESEWNRKLFGKQAGRYCLVHDFTEFMKGDTKSLLEAIKLGTGGKPVMTQNEGRRWLSLNPHPDGDELEAAPEPAPATGGGEPAPKGDDREIDALDVVFRDAAERCLSRESKRVTEGLMRCHQQGKDAGPWLDGFYAEHLQYVERALRPGVVAGLAMVGHADPRTRELICVTLAAKHVEHSRQAIADGSVDGKAWLGRAEALALEALACVRSARRTA